MCRFLVLALVAACASLQANSFGFKTAGTDSNGNPVGASVVFTILDAHDFTATLSDTAGSILEFQQLLEGLKFSFGGSGLLLVGSNGERLMIGSNGAVTVLGTGSTGWGTGASGGDWLLCASCDGSQGGDIVGSDASLNGMFLGGNVTFTFTTASSLPTDGTDPFGNVTFMFENGETVVVPAAVASVSPPRGNQGSNGSQGQGGNQGFADNGPGAQFSPATGGASDSGGNSGTTGASDPGTTGSNNIGSPNPGDPGTTDFGASGTPGGSRTDSLSDPLQNVSVTSNSLALPEPATLPLTGAVLLGLAFCRKRSGGDR